MSLRWITPVLTAFVVSACGGSKPPSAREPAAPVDMSLRGTIDARPFAARSAFAKRRDDNGEVDVVAFERVIPPERACEALLLPRDDAERIVVQMPWPLPEGTSLPSLGAAQLAERQPKSGTAGVQFSVRRGLGESWQRALGSVVVRSASPSGGTLDLDVASTNEPGGVPGSIRGALPFRLCPPG